MRIGNVGLMDDRRLIEFVILLNNARGPTQWLHYCKTSCPATD